MIKERLQDTSFDSLKACVICNLINYIAFWCVRRYSDLCLWSKTTQHTQPVTGHRCHRFHHGHVTRSCHSFACRCAGRWHGANSNRSRRSKRCRPAWRWWMLVDGDGWEPRWVEWGFEPIYSMSIQILCVYIYMCILCIYIYTYVYVTYGPLNYIYIYIYYN